MKVLLIRAVGLIIWLFVGYMIVVKQIIMPIVGVRTEGVVPGFKVKGSFKNVPVERSYDKKMWSARTPYVRFLPENSTDSLTVLSDGNAFFSFLNYSKDDVVTVAYWKGNPQSATIINWREYPVMLFLGFVGGIFLFGKAPKGY